MAEGRGSGRRATAHPLLLELGTEELPARALPGLADSLGRELVVALRAASLVDDSRLEARWLATPRRLAVIVEGVLARQPDQTQERRGPALSVAFAGDGSPTKAAEGFARSCGVGVEALGRLETDKGAWLVYRSHVPGQAARAVIPGCVSEAVRRMAMPKRMRWGSGDEEFVRPLHWALLLHGSSPVPATVLGVRAAPYTHGHRFHCPKPLRVASVEDYDRVLARRGSVIADFAGRRERIRRQAARVAARVGAHPDIDPSLLDEVTSLVEWPQAVLGSFSADFLELPAEVLVSTMQVHQKYFPVRDKHGALLAHFVTVSNIRARQPARIRAGNERVLQARLADARFFWEEDRKTRLELHLEGLRGVLFHEKLGSMHDKTLRTVALAAETARRLDVDAVAVKRAATLAKTDLMTQMVGEFPELQGVMGRYYAAHDGEADVVSAAIGEHYRPRFAGDGVPATPVGQVVAIADKVDSMVGLFAAGDEPTGDRDPYALRRAALGVLRILVEKQLDLDLAELLEAASRAWAEAASRGQALPAVDAGVRERVLEFLLERLRAHYLGEGFAADEVAAVMARRPTRPADFDRRLRAVASFRRMPEAESLSAANKRIRNILRQAAGAGPSAAAEVPAQARAALMEHEAERRLAAEVERLAATVAPLVGSGEYDAALRALATLRAPVDAFFDEVMVMVEDPAVRANRLAILERVSRLFLDVADVSRLQG